MTEPATPPEASPADPAFGVGDRVSALLTLLAFLLVVAAVLAIAAAGRF